LKSFETEPSGVYVDQSLGKKENMKSCKAIDAFFLSNPFYRGMAEKIILVGTGICGLAFSWRPFPIFPFSHLLGGVLIISAYGFHWWMYRSI
jgi:hypothetical protein